MNRVLVTGGVGASAGAIVKRLLGDPAYEVRISDRRGVPQWMREGAEVHGGDLRVVEEARAAMEGCTHVIHLAGLDEGVEAGDCLPLTLMEANNALYNAVIRAAVEQGVERYVYMSSSRVFERATEFPTTEAHLPDCPTPMSAYGFSRLIGEACCRAAHEEHGLQYTICRPFGACGVVSDLTAKALSGRRPLEILGAGERTRTVTHVDDIADGVVTAMGSAAGVNEDFNISTPRELTVAEIARIVWETCGEDPGELMLECLPARASDVRRRWPSVEKARKLLGWEARIEARDAIAATVASVRARGSVGSAA
jgi:UDP-glucose 4-epimerase